QKKGVPHRNLLISFTRRAVRRRRMPAGRLGKALGVHFWSTGFSAANRPSSFFSRLLTFFNMVLSKRLRPPGGRHVRFAAPLGGDQGKRKGPLPQQRRGPCARSCGPPV